MHTTTVWRSASYVHQSYALEGRHAQADCVDCHTGSTFGGLASAGNDCISCHLAEYQSTATLGGTVPDHVAGGFSGDCRLCHTNVDPPVTFAE